MSKNETKNPATAAPKDKIQQFGEALNKFVKANFDSVVEKKDGKIFLRGVDLGKGKTDFRIEYVKHEPKNGKRASHVRNLYRINADGSERVVQFGRFKKLYLYPLMNAVIRGKLPRKATIKQDPALAKKIADAVRADRKSFKMDKGVLTGAIKGIGDIKMVEIEHICKTGKKVLERKLYISGKLALEGGQVGRVKNAFIHTNGHQRLADVMAEANAAVSDLI